MAPPPPLVAGPSGAKFSACRKWRYLLWRRWAEGPAANFVMLNPSTADEVRLDPTCTRARRYAERWGFGALIVTNVFAWRSTDPAALYEASDPVGRGNDRAIVQAAREAALVVCAWGNHAQLRLRSSKVLDLLSKERIELHALKLNDSGEPAHPLYLAGSLQPRPWPTPTIATRR